MRTRIGLAVRRADARSSITITLVATVAAGVIIALDRWDTVFAAARPVVNGFIQNVECLAIIANNALLRFFTPFDSLAEVGQALAWAGQQIKQLGRLADRYLGPVADAVGDILGTLNKKAEVKGGISLDGMGLQGEAGAAPTGGLSKPSGNAPSFGATVSSLTNLRSAQEGKSKYAGQSAKTVYNEGDIYVDATVSERDRRSASGRSPDEESYDVTVTSGALGDVRSFYEEIIDEGLTTTFDGGQAGLSRLKEFVGGQNAETHADAERRSRRSEEPGSHLLLF